MQKLQKNEGMQRLTDSLESDCAPGIDDLVFLKPYILLFKKGTDI